MYIYNKNFNSPVLVTLITLLLLLCDQFKSPTMSEDYVGRAWEIRRRLENCWGSSLDWSMFPTTLKEVQCDITRILKTTLTNS